MDPTWAALIGVVVGSILNLVGTSGITWFQAKREEERLAKERLRDNLYALQDAIDPIFRHAAAAIQAKRMNPLGPPIPSPELMSDAFRINMLSTRVGDGTLTGHLAEVLENLVVLQDASRPEEAVEAYNAALAALDPVQRRIDKLLHPET